MNLELGISFCPHLLAIYPFRGCDSPPRNENKVGHWIAGEYVRKFGLPLVADDMTEILVMGTMPSDISLAKREYYGNPSNDFWRLVGAVLNRDVAAMSYDDRLGVLKAHRIGLWDAYQDCLRPGSLDSDITEPRFNDYCVLKTVAPRLRLVCFNGREAAKSDDKIRGLGYETCVLPSSSPANRRDSAVRVRLWKSSLIVR